MAIEKQLHKRTAKNAERRTIEWDLPYQTWLGLVTENCYYCGVEPSNVFKYGKGEFTYSGIDRIDSGLGYTASNCVPCCRFCNVLKFSMKPDTWFDFLKAVISNHGGEIPRGWVYFSDPDRARKAPNLWGRVKKR